MAYDATDAEVEIGGILDRLGSELLAASKRLRFAPYAAVAPFVTQSRTAIRQVCIAGETLLAGHPDTALAMLRTIDVPEIEFNDANEEVEPHF